jgi:hypothetical protein
LNDFKPDKWGPIGPIFFYIFAPLISLIFSLHLKSPIQGIGILTFIAIAVLDCYLIMLLLSKKR